MKAWVCILKCSDGSYYTGSTNNLELRLAQHAAGEGSQWTRARLPVHLAFAQDLSSEHEAFLCERQIKGWSRAKKEALIRGDFDALVELSKNRVAQQDDGVDQEAGDGMRVIG
jgi:predicted GIY-YIG superfamily endonuclease